MPAKPKKKRLVLGRDFDGWAWKHEASGKWLLDQFGVLDLYGYKGRKIPGHRPVRVKFVEVK